MRTFTCPSDIPEDLRGVAASIGNFDGVHRGHQRLLRRARQLADRGPVVVITFDPPPMAILRPEHAPRRLTPLPEKLRLLEQAGVDAAVVLQTDWQLLRMPPAEFLDHLIVPFLSPRWIVEGPSFAFGQGRSGTMATLRALSPRYGYEACEEPAETLDLGDRGGIATVSSTLIRQLLSDGRATAASLALGRPYALLGRVVPGRGEGARIGFPTINLGYCDQHLPADGVYAGRAELDGHWYRAGISIGCRPTFGGQERVVEAFLLDADSDFYDRMVRLEVVDWLRPQKRLASPAELAAQIEADVEHVRRGVTV